MNTVMEIPPNKDYIEMNFVAMTATGKGKNSQVIMENLHDETFSVTEGRVNIVIGRNKPRTWILPIEKWEEEFTRYVNNGYIVTKTKKTDKKEKVVIGNSGFKTIADNIVRNFIDRLLAFANQAIATNYTIKVDEVSPEMLALAKKDLEELSEKKDELSVAQFNMILQHLYKVLPRRIDNLSKNLAKQKSDFRDIIANEFDLYDIMAGQASSAKEDQRRTILEANGLTVRNVTDEEKAWIVKRLGSESKRYINAWKITNEKTERAFNENCNKMGFTEKKGIEHLFHGSRNENFWSIITNGLTVRPSGVVITGKMFGNGTYFAPDACKSMGYTSRSGSRWANGSSNSGFLGIYKVAVGNSAAPDRARAYDYKSLSKDGFHSVWCKRGGQIGLRMDEVVVYQDWQSTVEYLVEIGF